MENDKAGNYYLVGSFVELTRSATKLKYQQSSTIHLSILATSQTHSQRRCLAWLVRWKQWGAIYQRHIYARQKYSYLFCFTHWHPGQRKIGKNTSSEWRPETLVLLATDSTESWSRQYESVAEERRWVGGLGRVHYLSEYQWRWWWEWGFWGSRRLKRTRMIRYEARRCFRRRQFRGMNILIDGCLL